MSKRIFSKNLDKPIYTQKTIKPNPDPEAGKLKPVRGLKCDSLKDRVSFRFKDLKNPTIKYHAGFSPESRPEKKHWLDIYVQPSRKYIFKDEAWTTFRQNATFNDIFENMRTYDIHDIMTTSDIPDFSDYTKWTDIKFLKELSKHSEWLVLVETFAATRLSFLLKTVQVANSKAAKKAANNLHDYLIPGRRGGSKSYPENFRGGLFLLNDLSKYISQKCRSFLCGEKAVDKYDDLQEWGKTEEQRILKMPQKKLTLLIDKPAMFAETILSEELIVSVSSLKGEI